MTELSLGGGGDGVGGWRRSIPIKNGKGTELSPASINIPSIMTIWNTIAGRRMVAFHPSHLHLIPSIIPIAAKHTNSTITCTCSIGHGRTTILIACQHTYPAGKVEGPTFCLSARASERAHADARKAAFFKQTSSLRTEVSFLKIDHEPKYQARGELSCTSGR